jgi:hypothetical protein
MKKTNLLGKKFGKLTVIEEAEPRIYESGHRRNMWKCQCECGNITIVPVDKLTGGHTQSCGCLHRKKVGENNKKTKTKHGLSKSRIHNIWRGMNYRCNNEDGLYFKDYGGRGIKICDEWANSNTDGFINFYNWAINNGYSDELSIDRIDVNGNYEPSNCRWATLKEQANNKRSTITLTVDGITHSISEWSELTGINKDTIETRKRLGWSDKEAVSKDTQNYNKKKDLTGLKFGKLTVIEEVAPHTEPNGRKSRRWKCKCECGNETVVFGYALIKGHTKSCGCLHKKHGMRHDRIYKIWVNMNQRCNNENNSSYKDYGGRGIHVCNEWLNTNEDGFTNFYNWSINNGYSDKLTIDRINSDNNYEPNNCRWATIKEQSNNRRTNTYITIDGVTHTISEWSEITGVNQHVISTRRRRGWSDRDAVMKPTCA